MKLVRTKKKKNIDTQPSNPKHTQGYDNMIVYTQNKVYLKLQHAGRMSR